MSAAGELRRVQLRTVLLVVGVLLVLLWWGKMECQKREAATGRKLCGFWPGFGLPDLPEWGSGGSEGGGSTAPKSPPIDYTHTPIPAAPGGAVRELTPREVAAAKCDAKSAELVSWSDSMGAGVCWPRVGIFGFPTPVTGKP